MSAYNSHIARASIRCLFDQQQVQNSVYFKKGGDWTQGELVTLAEDVGLFWIANMLLLQSSRVQFVSVESQQMVAAPAPTHTFTAASTHVGAQSASTVPNNASMAISFRTGLSGRSYRGRNYWYGLTEQQVDGNIIDQTLRHNVAAAYFSMFTQIGLSLNAEAVVFSRIANGVERPTGVGTPITSVVVIDSYVDSQRRRLPNRGR